MYRSTRPRRCLASLALFRLVRCFTSMHTAKQLLLLPQAPMFIPGVVCTSASSLNPPCTAWPYAARSFHNTPSPPQRPSPYPYSQKRLSSQDLPVVSLAPSYSSSAHRPTLCITSSRKDWSLSLSPTWSHQSNTKRSMMYADHGVNSTSPLSALASSARRPSLSRNSTSETLAAPRPRRGARQGVGG